MCIVTDSKKIYTDAHSKRQLLDNKITLKYQQIERLKNRSEKIHGDFWWANVLIKPIVEELRNEFPNLYFDDHNLVALGMRCAVSVFASDKEPQDGEDCKTRCAITFTTGDIDKGELFYDMGEYKTSEIYRASFRDANGFDNVTAPVTDIQVLVDYIKKRLK